MKKLLSLVLILSAVFIVSGCSSSDKKTAGIYHCENWQNRGQAVIMLNSDGSCEGPFVYQNSKWEEEDDIIVVVGNGNEAVTETVYIVDEGIVYNSHFFKKLK